MFTYADDDERIPFDPLVIGPQLAGCLLCGRCVTAVGIFLPMTDAMRAAVLRLRRHAVRASTSPALAYGVCADHLAEADLTDRVEAALLAAAERVRVQ